MKIYDYILIYMVLMIDQCTKVKFNFFQYYLAASSRDLKIWKGARYVETAKKNVVQNMP